jgi:hypothetical protein
MYPHLKYLLLSTALAWGLSGCGAAAAEEPSESQMKEAMLYAMNHPPGETNSAPISITFFKKEGCEKPTPRGFNCSFDVTVASTNIGASMYNNIPSAVFYKDKDSGKWTMRPPF